MSLFDFFFCNGCRNSTKLDIGADIDLTSLEILSINNDLITIYLESKISLNCTNFHPSDCLYLYSNPNKSQTKFSLISNKEFLPQNKS